MKKIITSICLIFSILLLLTSCIRETHNIRITPNGGSVQKEQTVTKEVYDTLISMGAEPSDFKKNGDELSFYTEEGTEYVKVTHSEKFNSLDELNSYLRSLGDQAEEGSDTDISDRYFSTIKVRVDENKNLSVNGKFARQKDVSCYTSCDIVFKFSGKIISHDIGEKVDDNTVIINMVDIWKSSSDQTFSIVSEVPSPIVSLLTSEETAPVLLIVVAVILVELIAAICIILVVSKKKKASQSIKVIESTNTENALEVTNDFPDSSAKEKDDLL